ncbi:MAG: SLC13 family permease [Promethearchaeia archaeon]
MIKNCNVIHLLNIIIVLFVLIVSFIFFIWGRWRYDIVALMALFAITISGIIPPEDAFLGFANSAVITVVAILVITKGLINSGFVDFISKWISKVGNRTISQIAVLTFMVTILSAFMNNVGALALLMPVAIKIAKDSDKSPSLFLMPIAFASQFGGWITLIGTPTNLIVSSFRVNAGIGPFSMFEFAPIGIIVALSSILFITLIGWRIIPLRTSQSLDSALSQIKEYLTELYVTEESKSVGKRIYNLGNLKETEISIITLIRNNQRIPLPSHLITLKAGDVLICKGNQEDLNLLVEDSGLDLMEKKKVKEKGLDSDNISVVEAVIAPNSMMDRKTLGYLDLRNRFRVNVLAIAHQESRSVTRLSRVQLRVGDVLMLQAPSDTLESKLSTLGLLPLAKREIRLGKPRQMYLALIIFGTALILTALNILQVHIAFSLAAVAMVLFNIISLQEAYKSVNWPVVILLGAMIPVGLSLKESGGAELIASALLGTEFLITPIIALLIMMIVVMILSNVVNNVAAVILITPIAINLAQSLGVSIDPFLIAIIIGGSAAFLTPIGHQSNVLVMGPGGYKFTDYWRLGIFIQIITVVATIPLILFFYDL